MSSFRFIVPIVRHAFGFVLFSVAALPQAAKLVDAHVHHNGDAGFLKQLVLRLEKHNGVAFLLVRPEHLKQVSDFMAAHPGRLIGFGDVSLDDPRALDRIDEFHRAGFRGLGELSRTRKPFDDAAYTPIYDRAARYGMMLLFHTGIVNRTRPDVAEDVSVDRLRVTLLDNIARRYPTLTIIGAHLETQTTSGRVKSPGGTPIFTSIFPDPRLSRNRRIQLISSRSSGGQASQARTHQRRGPARSRR